MKNSRYEVIPYDNNLGTCDSVIISYRLSSSISEDTFTQDSIICCLFCKLKSLALYTCSNLG